MARNRPSGRSRLPLALALALGLSLNAACRSHGKYTAQAKQDAQQRAHLLRAATEYDVAAQQHQSGDLERALATIDNSISLDSEVAPSQLLRARILLELGRARAALLALEQAARLDPLQPDAPYYRGVVLEHLGQLDAALVAYRQALQLDPAEALYRLAAAEVLVDLGRSLEARAALDAKGGDFASHPGLRQALGHIAMIEGDQEAAQVYFSEAVALGPGDPVLLEDLCHAQIATASYAQAEATLRRLARERDYAQRADLQHLHAACLLHLNRPMEARAVLMQLTRRERGAHDLKAWNGLVDVALMLHDTRLLRSAAERLLVAAPGQADGFLALAMWQRQNGDLDAALRSAERAIERATDDPTPAKLAELIRDQAAAGG